MSASALLPAGGVQVVFIDEAGAKQSGALEVLWRTGFEHVSPVRSFGSFQGQRSFQGSWWLATTGEHVGFESWVERDAVMLLDFDPDVVAVSSQPFCLRWAGQPGARRNVPGEALARHLSAPAGGDLGDPVGRAMLSALLGPGTGHAPDAAVLPGPGDGNGARERRPAHQPASPDPTMSRFAGDIVNRLFSIGLSLDSARGIAGDGPAGDRIAAVTGEIDRLIRDIRTIVFGPEDHQQRRPGPNPDRWSLPPG